MSPYSGQCNRTKRHGAMSSGDVSIGNQVPTMSPYSGQSNRTKRHGAMSSGDVSTGNQVPTLSPCSGQSNRTKRHGAISHTTSISHRRRNNFQARDSITFCIPPSASQFVRTTVNARRDKDYPKRHTCAEQHQPTLQPSVALSTPFNNRVSFFHPFLLINST